MKVIFFLFLFIPIVVYNQTNFIGKPIRFTYVEVAQNDAPKKLTYDAALLFIKEIGKGWRLPTKEELLKMYEKRDLIKGFEWGEYYLSDEVYGKNLVYVVEFADGKLDKGWRYFNGNEIHYNIRLIRTIKQ
jgi:hypothetical protein